jgi:hypothetical protein
VNTTTPIRRIQFPEIPMAMSMTIRRDRTPRTLHTHLPMSWDTRTRTETRRANILQVIVPESSLVQTCKIQ